MCRDPSCSMFSAMRGSVISFAAPIPTQPRRSLLQLPKCRHPQFRVPTARIGERILAVDYGLRRTGLAVSVGVAPRPLPRLEHRRSPREAASGVASTAKSTLSETILVGYPVDTHGREGEQATATKIFLRELVAAAPWARILYLDERYTSQDAREELLSAGVRKDDVRFLIDSASAVVLLNRFFSDGDEINAVEVHRPSTTEKSRRKSVERVSFAEWKKQTMNRARQSAEDDRAVHGT